MNIHPIIRRSQAGEFTTDTMEAIGCVAHDGNDWMIYEFSDGSGFEIPTEELRKLLNRIQEVEA